MQQQLAKEERSIGELFTELAGETSTLVRQEIDLARVELSQKASDIGKNVAWLSVGGVVGLVGILAVTTALILLLSKVMEPWLAAVLVGGAYLIAAGVMVMSALKAIKETDLAPRQTVETLKEDTQWLKNQIG
ncbi:MAG: phage holin family protein [Pyrinomonadaceae bacterium]